MVEEFVKKIENEMSKENWGVKINGIRGMPFFKVNISPDIESPIIMLGNKFAEDATCIHISLIDEQEINTHLQLAKKLCDKKDLFTQHVAGQQTQNPTILARLDYILNHCFSKSFVEENKLSGRAILEQNPKPNKSLITGKDIYQSKRYMEVFEDFKVILSFSPYTQKYHFSILFFNGWQYRDKDYLTNPISSIFENEYHYHKYLRAIERHYLDFREIQGAPMYPEATYNTQSFAVTFNCFNVEGTPFNLFATSARNQKKLVNTLVRYVYLLFGSDLNRNGAEELEENVVKIPKMLPDNIQKSKASYYHGFRLYSLPLYDIEIGFRDDFEWDDDDNEFPVAKIETVVKPFKLDHPEAKGGYYHPLIYEWEK